MTQPTPPQTGTQPKLKLTPAAGTPVEFDFNPENIKIEHSTEDAAPPVVQTDQTTAKKNIGNMHQPKTPNPFTIGITGLKLLGTDVQTRCEQLLTWTVPVKTNNTAVLPPLTASWGTLTFANVRLKHATIKYERFTSGGMPIRADVSLTLSRTDAPPLGTNPTSGGLPGRRSHTVIAGENLQHIAMSADGRPAAWRAIAAANGIEDPLRVHPGDVLYLPGPEEVSAGGRP
jgi:nucleoid-associated protein YgaU